MAVLRPDKITATMRAGYAICSFANGNCPCSRQGQYPCESVQGTARLVIDAAKDELAEKFILRKRPSE